MAGRAQFDDVQLQSPAFSPAARPAHRRAASACATFSPGRGAQQTPPRTPAGGSSAPPGSRPAFPSRASAELSEPNVNEESVANMTLPELHEVRDPPTGPRRARARHRRCLRCCRVGACSYLRPNLPRAATTRRIDRAPLVTPSLAAGQRAHSHHRNAEQRACYAARAARRARARARLPRPDGRPARDAGR